MKKPMFLKWQIKDKVKQLEEIDDWGTDFLQDWEPYREKVRELLKKAMKEGVCQPKIHKKQVGKKIRIKQKNIKNILLCVFPYSPPI